MPPAFNLSQDQTLQFNPSKSLNRRWPHPNPAASTAKPEQDFPSCEHSKFPSPQCMARATHQDTRSPPAPTLIGCNLLKNGRPDELTRDGSQETPAKRRDYAAFPRGGQQSLIRRRDAHRCIPGSRSRRTAGRPAAAASLRIAHLTAARMPTAYGSLEPCNAGSLCPANACAGGARHSQTARRAREPAPNWAHCASRLKVVPITVPSPT